MYEKLGNTKNDYISPYEIFKIYDKKLESFDFSLDFHPVIAIRTLLSKTYNQCRRNLFEKMLFLFFPKKYSKFNYYNTSKQFNNLKFVSHPYFKIHTQNILYLITRFIQLIPKPLSKSKNISNEQINDVLSDMINFETDKINDIYNEYDIMTLKNFDSRYEHPQEINKINIPVLPFPLGKKKIYDKFIEICNRNEIDENIEESVRKYKSSSCKHLAGVSKNTTENIMPTIITPRFMEDLMDLYKDYMIGLLSNDEMKRYIELDHFYRVLFKKYMLNSFVEENYYSFRQNLNKQNISYEIMDKFLLNPFELNEKYENPTFSMYLELLRCPLIHIKTKDNHKRYKYNEILFSFPLLFDSYIYNLLKFLKNSRIGMERGKESEDIISDVIAENLYTLPFKLIIKQGDQSKNERYQIMLSQNENFKYETIIIELPEDYPYSTLNFREIDSCFIHNNQLYIIECKDNLYMDLFDHPDLCLKWVLENLRRLKFKQKLCYKLRKKIALEYGIKFNQVIPIFLSNVKVPINNCYVFTDFKKLLRELQKTHEMDCLTRKYEEYLISRIENLHLYRKKTEELKTQILLYLYYKALDPPKANDFCSVFKNNLKQSEIYSKDLWNRIFS